MTTADAGTVPLVRALGERHHVGRDAEALRCEGRAHAPEAGNHLVEDEQDAVPVADFAQPLQIALRRRIDADGTGDRLDDDRRDGRGIVQIDDPLKLVGQVDAVLGPRPG